MARRAIISVPIMVGDGAIIACEARYYSTICCCKRGCYKGPTGPNSFLYYSGR